MAKQNLTDEHHVFCDVFKLIISTFFEKNLQATSKTLSENMIKDYYLGRSFPTKAFTVSHIPHLIGAIDWNTTLQTVETFSKTVNPIIQYSNLDIPMDQTLQDYVRKLLHKTYSLAQESRVSSRKKEVFLLSKLAIDKIATIIHKLPKSNTTIDSIKAVIFDFDGTLTTNNITGSTWESIWLALGYSKNDCQNLHIRFNNGEFTHPEWCELTEEKFIGKKLNKHHLVEIISKIKLIKNIEIVFQELENKGIQIYVLSGSIKYIIQKALNGYCKYLSDIKANEFIFDADGYMTRIIGTNYDFEGKAKYLNYVAEKLNIESKKILFVGNSNNDEFAHNSGVKTLCINPTALIDSSNRTIWHDSIPVCSDLTEILDFID